LDIKGPELRRKRLQSAFEGLEKEERKRAALTWDHKK